jgi:hypothetical protein
MQQNVARRPRFKRVPDLPPICLTERDRAILSAVSQFRFLTTSHIRLLVPGSAQNIARRLQRLYHAGFLDRPRAQLPLRSTGEISEIVYSQSRKTVSGKKYGEVSFLFLKHALSVSDALIAIELACRHAGLTFTRGEENIGHRSGGRGGERLRWTVTLRADDTNEKLGIIPDAEFAIENRNRAGYLQRFHFFLEADRGTMPVRRKTLRLSSIYRKALAYSQTRRSGILKERFGIPGFRVLFITRSRDRLERMKEVCSEALRDSRAPLFVFATPEEFRGDPLAKLGVV